MSTIATDARRTAIARAGRIRQGIHSYLATLAEISAAYNERDWVALGYADWQSYVDEEYGADRLRLPAEHRQKAVTELRLAGMSQRAIASATGVDRETVAKDLREAEVAGFRPPERITGADGKTYAASQPGPDPELEEDEDVLDLGEVLEGEVQSAKRWTEAEESLRGRVLAGETVVASLRGEHQTLLRWAEDNGLFVRIDRRTEWGNPFEIPGDGDRQQVIDSYALHYLPHKPSLLAKLETLRGKVLFCWCSPEACHGDVLVAALDQP